MEANYEICVNNMWFETTLWIFRSWSGPRRIDGKPYTGPTYYLGSDDKVKSSPRKG